MQMKKARNARMIFAFMVPLTLFAFWLGAMTNPSLIDLESMDVYDSVSARSTSISIHLMMSPLQSQAFQADEVDICSFF